MGGLYEEEGEGTQRHGEEATGPQRQEAGVMRPQAQDTWATGSWKSQEGPSPEPSTPSAALPSPRWQTTGSGLQGWEGINSVT